MTQHEQAQRASDIAIIFRVHECYDILSVQSDIFGYCTLLTKIYDLMASYREPEFSFTTDLFNLKTSVNCVKSLILLILLF